MPGEKGMMVRFTSQSGMQIELRREHSGSLVGAALPNGGPSIPLQFEKTTLPAVHQWNADNPAKSVRASKESIVELVYLSASNCPYCRGWENEYLERGKLKNSPEWNAIRFTEVKRGTFNATVRVDDVPEHLRPAIGEVIAFRGRAIFGAPWFVLVVNGHARTYMFGTHDFDSQVYAAIRAALREKSAGGPI